ncbi:MAG TPA: patatin-like phospholipase family protein, partial [bacterium]|nr:patatin-like phospholipase family protein [bacterium]
GEKKHGAFEEREMTSGVRIFSLLPSATAERERYRDVLRYLAKEMSGTLLGLALGSGAAYGLAHIGVIKALEREGIIPDVVVGSSIGALVGGLWAAGFSGQEMEDVAKSIDKRSGFFKLLGFRDMSVAHQGFFKGNQITRFLETYIGDKTFRDLKRPLKIIAADLFTSEEVILESGKVSEAIRASSSIPGIFRPLWHQGRYLIDGGVIDPLPIRILTSAGVKKIIAVNVLPGPHDRMERNTLRDEMRRQEQVTLKKAPFYKRLLARGLHKVYNRYTVNIFNVIMSTIQFMEYEMAQSWGAQADILIHPIVKEAHWAEFYSPEKFIKVGEQKTEEQLDEIKRLIQE